MGILNNIKSIRGKDKYLARGVAFGVTSESSETWSKIGQLTIQAADNSKVLLAQNHPQWFIALDEDSNTSIMLFYSAV